MLQLESYEEHERHLPSKGRFIIGQFNENEIVIYQAFKKSIAEFAVANQKFGGEDYDFNRHTQLKPSFLWMMYYSGWAHKKNQEHVLAITLSIPGFEELLDKAVLIDKGHAETDAPVSIHWESYHDLFGNKTERMAAKIVLKGAAMKQYNDSWIKSIEDISDYVQEQQALLEANKIADIRVPRERAYAPQDLNVLRRLNATGISL